MENNLQTEVGKYFSVVREKNEIYYCDQVEEVESKFSDAAQDDLFELEDTSWWFQYRADVIAQIAQRFFDKKKMIFDVGGGNGYTTYHLQELGYDIGLLEPSHGACINAKRRGIRTVICGTLTEDTVKDASMKQITVLDVLEHIEHDAEFLKIIWKKMELGGGSFTDSSRLSSTLEQRGRYGRTL